MPGKVSGKPSGFRVSARTILQLGGELISSDGIAFYELIKNAVDAGSKKAFIDVQMLLPLESVQEVKQAWDKSQAAQKISKTDLQELKDDLVESILSDAPDADARELKKELRAAESLDSVLQIVVDANSITFRDTGSGMDLDDLETVYLTVGTPHRLEQRRNLKKSGGKKIILGEKGIGRLSAMRLGNRLQVETSTSDDANWNTLEINWNDFSRDSAQLLDEIEVVPRRGAKKTATAHGTTIRISDLNSTWTLPKLVTIANFDLSRFSDPFLEKNTFSIHPKFNGTGVLIPRMDEVLRESAHALVEAQLTINTPKGGEPSAVLSGKVRYLNSPSIKTPLKGRVHQFSYNGDEITSALKKKNEEDVDFDSVVSLGPFSMECLWFNRRMLKSVAIDDKLLDLKKLVRQWSGGLMVYRDGFRVPPYGGPDDDWLDLDRGALASQGYKVNRAQLVGKVDISAQDNPHLLDQTNREGLRDCPEKQALVGLLKHVLEVQFRGYLKDVDEELRDQDRISFRDISEQLTEVEEKINNSLEELSEIDDEHPDLEIGALEKRLRRAFHTVVEIVSDVQESVDSVEDEKARVLHLAALGLSIEKLAHELNRASKHAIDALSQIETEDSGAALKRTAFLQLSSLRKRLQNLDPLLSPTRQTKQEFDLVKEVKAVLEGFEARFARHKVKVRVVEKTDGPIRVKFVKAMLIQVMENLIDNSVYWLTVGKRPKGSEEKTKEIVIVIDGERNVVEVSDTGPGIAPENKERVFRPFFTLKPAGQGKGLGLYIAREIAEYHGGSLTLLDRGLKATGRLHTFQLDISSRRV